MERANARASEQDEEFFLIRPVKTGLSDIQLQLENLYAEQCCGSLVKLADDPEWKSIMDDFAEQVYNGNYTQGQIPQSLYFKTAAKLSEAIAQSLGVNFDYDAPANMLAAEIRGNLYQFSAAKSLTEALLLGELVTDEEGKIKPFHKYRADVEKVHKNYNLRYLTAEYDNVIASGQMALKWRNYAALDVKWLQYRTANDLRVRQEHALLNNMVLPFNSPVWSRGFPPNDFGCRCTAVPVEEPPIKTNEIEAGRKVKKIVKNPIFDNNVGVTGMVYKNNHPYFRTIDGKETELDAVKNYGLKPVDTILKNPNLPPSIHLDTVEDYLAWWDDMVAQHGVGGNNFALSDKMGVKVLFDATPSGGNKNNYFRDHILRKSSEKRHEIAANLKDIIEDADEIWFNHYKGKVPNYSYVKYYNNNKAILISTTVNKSFVKAETMHYLDLNETKRSKRSGILMYRK